MALRKPPTPEPAPARGAQPPVPAPGGRGKLYLRIALLVGVGAAGWGAWAAFGPKPLREAQSALDRRDFLTATTILAKHLAEHPNDADARLLAARTARRDGEFARARVLLQEYSQKHPANADYELESNLLALHSGTVTNADKLFTEYSARPDAPDAPWVMEAYIEGTLKARAPNHASAIDPERDDPVIVTRLLAAADIWLAHRPGSADQVQGRTWQGRIYGYARDHDTSVAKYREALALDPEHFEARFHLALALVQSAPDECLRHYTVLLQQKPNNRFLRFLAATVRRRFGKFDESRQVLDAMLGSDPNDLAALIELGLLNLDENKPADAEPLLQRALKLSPNGPEANLAMSRCQQLAGRPAEAERYRKKFEEADAERNRPRVPPFPRP